MIAFARVGMLVERRAVETRQPPDIGRKMSGDPVDDHADAGGMAPVDEIGEILGIAIAPGRREQAEWLIAP